MKKVLVFCFSFLVVLSAFSQEVDFNKVILPSNLQDVEVQERLVQLAWKNQPVNRTFEEEVVARQEKLKSDKLGWLKGFAVSGNVNEFTLNPTEETAGRAAFYPKYNFSGRLDLGLIFSNPAKRRENQARVRVAEHEMNQQKLLIRQLVLKSHQDLLKFAEIYKLQSEITDDSYSNFLLSEQNFKDGKLTLDEYNKALERYNGEKKERIIAETQYLNAKYDLEFLIGLKLEEVF